MVQVSECLWRTSTSLQTQLELFHILTQLRLRKDQDHYPQEKSVSILLRLFLSPKLLSSSRSWIEISSRGLLLEHMMSMLLTSELNLAFGP